MVRPPDSVRLVDPREIDRNPENPRLVFREDELEALQESIASQGILVPLTIYQKGTGFVILDGERRWRCALKLGLSSVPAIIQPEPDAVTNIMMMFAIHKARSDWDPLPTALKLEQLEGILEKRLGQRPTEQQIAAAASLSRGEVRRYRNIAALPEKYKLQLLAELEKPRAFQTLTVDHVLESVRGAEALRKYSVITRDEENRLADTLVDKFARKVLSSTVEPRLLPRIARAVDRQEVSRSSAKRAVMRIVTEDKYTVKDAFRNSVEHVDFEHATEKMVDRITARLEEHVARSYVLGESLKDSLTQLHSIVTRILGNGR